MYTWFDALLVTLLAVMTALGARRGLVGLIWGVSGVLVCLLANALAPNPLVSGLLALLVSGAVAFGLARLINDPYPGKWALAAGGVGGLLLGGVLLTALTFNLPLERGRQNRAATYPAPQLTGPLRSAVEDSVIQRNLQGIWESGRLVRLLAIPDQAR